MNPLLQHEQSLIRAGHVSFFGAFAQQNPQAFVSMNRLLNAHNFDTIIELGTHDGGLSTLFALYCCLAREKAVSANPNEPCLYKNQTHHRSPKQFWTYDIVARDLAAIKGIERLHGCFLERDTLNNPNVTEEIRDLIKWGKSTLLLCDGGNKKRELELYGPALKSGDFVMLHDWAYDAETFKRNKEQGIWYSHETMWTDEPGEGRQFGIKMLCELYGIEPIYADEFDKVAWFCGRKT